MASRFHWAGGEKISQGKEVGDPQITQIVKETEGKNGGGM
jgi:hypothetical protein